MTNYCKIETIIVIPTYNIGDEFLFNDYNFFLKNNENIFLCFVNDGSTDQTFTYLKKLNSAFKNQIHIISYQTNLGKAEATRKGINYCNTHYNFNTIGFLDVDLATSLQEFMRLNSLITNEKEFIFGSRKSTNKNNIIRKYYRFFIGRIIAFIISKILNLNTYDTQCGCKVFTKNLSIIIFNEKFISKWLFDVELFLRMKTYYGIELTRQKISETTLNKWEDRGNSKISFLYLFKLWIDLFKINKKYSTNYDSINIKQLKNEV